MPHASARLEVPAKDRLIVALDLTYGAKPFKIDSLVKETEEIVDSLGDAVTHYKIGLRLFPVFGRVLEYLRAKEKQVFLDLKSLDIPETVTQTAMMAAALGIKFITVNHDIHAVRAARFGVERAGENNATKVLFVPFLTSLDETDLREMYNTDEGTTVSEWVERRAQVACGEGADGIICSGREAPRLREKLGNDILLVTPGIRPTESAIANDDQKRVVTPHEAIRNGADYIVVGRPIVNYPRDKREIVGRIIGEIESALTD